MVDFLNQAKNIVNGKDPDSSPVKGIDNRLDRVDQCKVFWYQWQKELTTDSKFAFNVNNIVPTSVESSELSSALGYDISNHIESVTFSKTMGSASGSFSFVLQNSFDWPRYMRPGQWLVIFMNGQGLLSLPLEKGSNVFSDSIGGLTPNQVPGGNLISSALASQATLDSTPVLPLPRTQAYSPDQIAAWKPFIRCIGIIQRVGIRSITNVDGTIETSFIVTGKDFGTIYEETELWFNANNAEQATFQSVLSSTVTKSSQNLTELLKIWHDIFLDPGSELTKSVTDVKSFFPKQWLLPDGMIDDLQLTIKAGGEGYFGDLTNVKELNATIFENHDPNPFAGLQGRCWDRLKNLSQPEFHELFTEISDEGNPKLIFRPIPFAMDTSRYPTLAKVMLTYSELASGEDVNPPVDVGTVISNLSSLEDDSLEDFQSDVVDDTRISHSVIISAVDVDNYDLGPDYHNRHNFFLVDSMKAAFDQQNAFALMSKNLTTPFPFRNENDIKRYGFRPMFVNLLTFNLTNAKFFGNTPSQTFMLETNELMRDFYANVDDFYSGSMTLAGGKNEIKLGKVILTDDSFQGISDMVFYIEGYTDNFVVSPDGACSWSQNLLLTRGIQNSVLDGGSSKDKQSTQSGTFHAFNFNAKSEDNSTLGKIKSAIKDPKSLF